MRTARFSLLLFLLISFSAQAEMYKWVGSDGKVNYSDIPPPSSVTRVEKKSNSVSGNNAELPYELTHAIKTRPVTLYSADQVAISTDARNFLIKNGIPFSEKTVSSNADIDKLKQITGSAQIPVLVVGSNKLMGFNSSEWRTTLTQAGYPESNLLPANYSFSVPQPLVPVAADSKQIEAKNDTNYRIKSSQPDPMVHSPNGFRF